MKKINLATVLGTSAAALSLATMTAVLPAAAQTNQPGPTGGDTTTTRTDDRLTDGNYADGDWGLLGLLGLFGLLGRKNREDEYDTTRESVGTTSTRY